MRMRCCLRGWTRTSRVNTTAGNVRQLDARPRPGRPILGRPISERTDCAEVPKMDHSFAAPTVGAPLAPGIHVPTRLLLVEDNASTSFAIRAFFQRVGYDVDAAMDHATAAQLLDD